MKLIFIYGMPATGKLTVAQELAKITGYAVFHNHLVVDMLEPMFGFGSAPFVELREQIWLSVFEQACLSRLPGLIFTFAPEKTVRPEFVGRVLETVRRAGGEVCFFELTCPIEELKTRLDSPSRLQFGKLNSLPLFEQLLRDGNLDSSHMPKAMLTVDTSVAAPAEAAGRIADALGLG